MDFAFSAEQESIRDAVSRICARFDDAFWLTHDREHRFPHEFYRAIADAGWLGIAMSNEVGGAGLGITEASLMMKTISGSGAGFSGASAIPVMMERSASVNRVAAT